MVSEVTKKSTIIGKLPADWRLQNIDELCEILDSRRIPLNKEEREKIKGDIPYYGANGVLDHINDYIFDEDLILMAEDGGYFTEYQTRPIAYRVKGKSWVNNHAHILKPKDYRSYDWIYYSLVHKNVLPFISGGTRAKLNQKELKKLPIAIPSIKEQLKITKILTSIDDAIEKTEVIIEQTEKVKKGLMQQLLTKGIGHTNFKETEIGEIPEEWEVLKMGDVIELVSGQSSSVKEVNKEGKGIGYVTGPEQWNGKNIIENKWVEKPRKISPKNCFFITVKGSGTGTIFPGGPFAIGRDIMAIVPTKRIERSFLYYLTNLQAERIVYNKVGMVPGISRGDILDYQIGLPKEKEQREISIILENLDNKLITEKRKLKVIKIIKKGLMQVLLTGIVRVKVDE
ncbi:restriction endonuclease subunit S [Alkalihalophilus marmarensis]|uniref:restriction endonuclease subunit S n=1 Tax=Alkalihalophilus marmarensis TaxID=521377 RepID=UPI002E1A53CC|nr:restriction endonuclease subunit S [Alkalihalophilus marmarensis]MED1602411.1 restriction endonuclease subunit S [Alkalihalophilus marmarensis]